MDRAGGGRRRTWPIVVAVALAVLVGGELFARAVSDRLPAPRLWSTPEAQVKVRQMQARAREGLTGGTVFLGTSLVDVGFDPPSFVAAGGGTRAYNASLASVDLRVLRWWTGNVVVPLLHPDTVVLGLTTRELNPNDPDQRNLGNEFFDAPAVRRRTGRERLLDRVDRIASEHSRLVAYRRILRRPTALVRHDPDGVDGDVQLSADGAAVFFRKASFVVSPAAQRSVRDGALFDFRVGGRELALLRGIVRDLRAGGVRVIAIDMPVTDVYAEWHPGGAATYRAAAARLRSAAADAGAEVVSYGVWPRRLFADPFHLNGRGTARVTAALAAAIRSGRVGGEPPPPTHGASAPTVPEP